MAAYNTQFELDITDLEHIETALQARNKELSLDRLRLLSSDGSDADGERLSALNRDLAEIHALLGRLHNQKIFYRPAAAGSRPYIGG